jgi:hypothetical protein
MMRVTQEIRTAIKARAKEEGLSMMELLHNQYCDTPYPRGEYKQTPPVLSNELKSMTMEQKVQLVLDKMKEMKLDSVHKHSSLDGNFWRAGKALGLSRPTIDKYWTWLYENHVRGV